ncbi:MAG TPA: penicillin-binding protein 1C, partial [Candidatus Methylomirabilis sp.]
SEDRRFYRHGGVDGQAMAGAAIRWLTGGGRRGASTISMQVATFLAPGLRRQGGPRSLAQKWRQMRAAWALEVQCSKAEILEVYLNRVTFRGELQGIAAAAAVLFGKVPHGLTEPEAAILTALIRAPNAGRESLARRALAVREAAWGRSGREEIAALAARVTDIPRGSGPRVTLAPHAAGRVLAEASSARPGEPIRTTLDVGVQRVAAEVLAQHLLAVRESRVQDGAVLVADNASGEVLAYVGGSGTLSSASQVDGVRARRQAGSTLKPFLYGLALERRLLTPASLLEDTPLDVPVAGGVYRPRNYDEHFRGLLTVRTALAGSVNVPAVRTLSLVGLDAFVSHLEQLGFTGLMESGEFYGPSLALGSADVSLWELVNAYRSLANRGHWSALRMTPDAHDPTAREAYSEATAFLLSSILADRESRSGTFGLENPLATRFWTAVKTGTSKDMRDNWCVGYSRRYTAGVWVGNFSGEPMRDVSGVTGAAPIWLELMAYLHRQTPSYPPSLPAGVVVQAVHFPRGVEPDRPEWFLAGTAPTNPSPRPLGVHPTILVPAGGTLIAIDPDIPAAQQRVMFEARVSDGATRWLLDGIDLGIA